MNSQMIDGEWVIGSIPGNMFYALFDYYLFNHIFKKNPIASLYINDITPF